MNHPRINPLEKPYSEGIGTLLDKFPQGPDGPIALFRTLAHSERALKKVAQSGLLDRESPIEMRDREIVILRTCVRCHCPYEWGVHVHAFAKHVLLTPAQVDDSASTHIDPTIWSEKERILIHWVDELVDDKSISDNLWNKASKVFSTNQLMELILLVGFYHSIAFLNNTLRITQEPGTPHFVVT